MSVSAALAAPGTRSPAKPAATGKFHAPAHKERTQAPSLSLLPLRWPPPMRVGQSRRFGASAKDTLTPKRRWCDFADISTKMQPLPVAQDPLFRPLSSDAAQEWSRLNVAMSAERPAPAQARTKTHQTKLDKALTALIQGVDGPSVARIALQHKSAHVRLIAARAALPLVAHHPRLASFAIEPMATTAAPLAIASMRMLLGAGCDTPALYAMDALDHPAPKVRAAAIEAAFRASESHVDAGVMGQLMSHAIHEETEPRLRALIARGITEAGWLPGAITAKVLLKDASPMVRAEALVAHAAVSRAPDLKRIRAALHDKRPLMRAGAIRAVALAYALQPEAGQRLLKPLKGQRQLIRDPLGVSPPLTLGALANEASNWLMMKP